MNVDFDNWRMVGQSKWMLCRRKRPSDFWGALGLDVRMLLLIPGESVLPSSMAPCIFYSCHLPAIRPSCKSEHRAENVSLFPNGWISETFDPGRASCHQGTKSFQGRCDSHAIPNLKLFVSVDYSILALCVYSHVMSLTFATQEYTDVGKESKWNKRQQKDIHSSVIY